MGWHKAGHEVAWLVILGILRDGQLISPSLKIGLKVWHSSVIDVLVWFSQAPRLWVFAKIRRHVLVNRFLEIHAQTTSERPNDHIGADAPAHLHVSIGISQGFIAGIVSHSLAYLRSCGGGNFRAKCFLSRRRGKGESQSEKAAKNDFHIGMESSG